MGKPRPDCTLRGDSWSPLSGWMGTQAMGGEQLHHLKKCDENHSPALLTGSGWSETIAGHEAEELRPSKTGEKK